MLSVSPESLSTLQTFVDLSRLVAPPATQNQADVVPFLFSKLSCSVQKQKNDPPACSGSCYIFLEGVKNILPTVAPCPCRFFELNVSPFFIGLLRHWDCRVSPAVLGKASPSPLAWVEHSDSESLAAAALVTAAFVAEKNGSLSASLYPAAWEKHCTPVQSDAAQRLQKIAKVEKVFSNSVAFFLNWQSLRPTYLAVPETFDQFAFSHPRLQIQTQLAKSGCLFLYWDFKNLSHKAGVNPEISAFEEFLADVESSGIGLVVFSNQALLPEETLTQSSLAPDYTRDIRTTYRDANNKLRFTSVKATAKPAPSMRECLRKGSFDRLLEALARGQRVLDRASRT